ncbi:hypothetical protein TSAR_009527 [Trichomalopsis sarcophagae]|uniref:Uncharacterized protein n=1 Tax=Trichomalopsis sarcophagae TaxID=543379 RepID=A0A232EGW7_9HYME|nr:hypothetical protein TSAR_009527 [Trichomalopsis sarcophagae]
MQSCNRVHRGPSKLFERAPLQPSDSLDEIAFQIPSLFNDTNKIVGAYFPKQFGYPNQVLGYHN